MAVKGFFLAVIALLFFQFPLVLASQSYLGLQLGNSFPLGECSDSPAFIFGGAGSGLALAAEGVYFSGNLSGIGFKYGFTINPVKSNEDGTVFSNENYNIHTFSPLFVFKFYTFNKTSFALTLSPGYAVVRFPQIKVGRYWQGNYYESIYSDSDRRSYISLEGGFRMRYIVKDGIAVGLSTSYAYLNNTYQLELWKKRNIDIEQLFIFLGLEYSLQKLFNSQAE